MSRCPRLKICVTSNIQNSPEKSRSHQDSISKNPKNGISHLPGCNTSYM